MRLSDRRIVVSMGFIPNSSMPGKLPLNQLMLLMNQSVKAAITAERKKVKQLERELRRKEKALAETAALLILSKKAQAIWGVKEED